MIEAKELRSLQEAYLSIYEDKETVEEDYLTEEVEAWVNSLIEEGYDLSDYTWDEMAEIYLDEELTGKRKTRAIRKFNSQNENPGRPDTNLAAVATMRHGSRATTHGNSVIYPADKTDTGNRPTKRGGSGEKGKPKTGYYDGGTELDRGSGNAAKRRMKEEVEAWVNYLVDEGYDLSEYTWDEISEIYLSEANKGDEHVTSNMYTSDNDIKTAKKRRRQIRDFKDVLHPDDYGSQGEPVRQKTHAQRRGVRTRGSGVREDADIYDIILSHLLDEGFATDEESAQGIMVNMSEDWRQSIVNEARKNSN